MYSLIDIRKFMCFESLELPDLGRINLVGGMNNTGKTALLEALFILSGATRPDLTVKVKAFRGYDKFPIGDALEAPWDSLFHGFDRTATIELIGEQTDSSRRRVHLRAVSDDKEQSELRSMLQPAGDARKEVDLTESMSGSLPALVLEYENGVGGVTKHYLVPDRQTGFRTVPPSPPVPWPVFFLAARRRTSFVEQAKLFAKMQIEATEELLLNVLRIIEPDLKSVDVIVQGDEPVLHGRIGRARPIPLALMGDGMGRLADLMMHISNAPGGVVLADEIENGLHHSVLADVWRAVSEASKALGTQIFATTHSRECVVAASEALGKDEDHALRYHRLDRTTDGIRAVTYLPDELEAGVRTWMEIR